jgi:hypothetical protein
MLLNLTFSQQQSSIDTIYSTLFYQYPDDYEEVTEEQLVEYGRARSEAPWETAAAPAHTTITGEAGLL